MNFIKKAIDLLGAYKTKIVPIAPPVPVYEGDKSRTIPNVNNTNFESNINNAPKYAAIITGAVVLIAAYKIFWKK